MLSQKGLSSRVLIQYKFSKQKESYLKYKN